MRSRYLVERRSVDEHVRRTRNRLVRVSRYKRRFRVLRPEVRKRLNYG